MTGADFDKKFLEVVEKDMKSRFGKVKLTLEEIKKKASEIVFDKQIESVVRFTNAAQETEKSLADVESLTLSMEKFHWKAEIGMTFSAEDIQNYKETADAYAESVEKYLENKHYESTVAIEMVLNVDTAPTLEKINGVYGQVMKEYQGYADELQAAYDEGTESGDMKGQMERITAAEKGMEAIKDRVADADEKGKAGALKARYGGEDMDSESFQALQASLLEMKKEAEEQYTQAYAEGLAALELGRTTFDENGNAALSEEDYKKQKEILDSSYNSDMEDLRKRIEDYELEAIASTFGKAEGEKFEDILAKVSSKYGSTDMEKLRGIIKTAVENDIDLSKKESLGKLDLGINYDEATGFIHLLDQVAKLYPEYQEKTALQQEGIDHMEASASGTVSEVDGEAEIANGTLAAGKYVEGFRAGIEENADVIQSAMAELKTLSDTYLQEEFNKGMSVSTTLKIKATYEVTGWSFYGGGFGGSSKFYFNGSNPDPTNKSNPTEKRQMEELFTEPENPGSERTARK